MSEPHARALAPGLEAQYERVVPLEWTIAHYDPALPAVFSTPAMIGMMEMAAAQAVLPALPPGTLTVGTRIEVDHLKAALVEVNGRFLTFEVEARRGDDLIGRGRVFRAIVEHARFVGAVALAPNR
jgi:fluoroacetyl-CoA thioesterase